MVVLNETGQAVGDLYWDDGDTIDAYEASLYNRIQFALSSDRTIRSLVPHWNYDSPSPSDTIQDITLIGVRQNVTSVQVNGSIYPNFTYNSAKKLLFIRSLNLPLKNPFMITYQ